MQQGQKAAEVCGDPGLSILDQQNILRHQMNGSRYMKRLLQQRFTLEMVKLCKLSEREIHVYYIKEMKSP